VSRVVTGSFGSFDGLDNRRELMELFARLGDGVPEAEGARRRQQFLQALVNDSTTGFSDKVARVSPCSAVEAYLLFLAITSGGSRNGLGVGIDGAAARLQALVRRLT